MKSVSILFLFISFHCFTQNKLDIEKAKALIGYNIYDYNHADSMPTDSLTDVKNGYFEVSYDYAKLCQIGLFKNKDGSGLVISTGYYSDEQCSMYFSYFHLIPSSIDTSVVLEPSRVLPALTFRDFFVGDSVDLIIKKYLPEINKNYLENGTIDQVISEVYDIHYIVPRKGTKLKVELTICDYIPTNAVSIDPKDWHIIETSIKPIYLKYNKSKKAFEIE